MFHRKRFRSIIAIILSLLLTAALVLVVSAQDAGEGGAPPPPVPPEVPTPATPVPTPPPTPPDPQPTPPDPLPTPPTPTATPDMGNGDNGMMAPTMWPPPNAIVRHAATPIQISALPGGLSVYFVGPDGATTGPVLASFSSLAEMHPDGAAVELFSGTNPGTGKMVTIEYLPAEMKIRVSTYYADKPPYDYNKPYVFIVDADHSVDHVKW